MTDPNVSGVHQKIAIQLTLLRSSRMYIMTLVPLFIVLPLIAAAAWFFRHKIKDALHRCRGRVARARHSISSGGKVTDQIYQNLPLVRMEKCDHPSGRRQDRERHGRVLARDATAAVLAGTDAANHLGLRRPRSRKRNAKALQVVKHLGRFTTLLQGCSLREIVLDLSLYALASVTRN